MIRIPDKWKKAADRFESEGIELSVIGHPRESLRLELVLAKYLDDVELSAGAVTALGKLIESLLANAAREAKRRKGKEIKKADIQAVSGR